jgi:hypothetical protein
MSPSVRALISGVAAPAVAVGALGGRLLVEAARSAPVPGRTGLEQAAAATISTVAGTVASAMDVLVPSVASAVLSRLDLTAVVTEQVDLDAVVREVDIDAVIARLDLTALVRERVDLDAIVREVDLDAVAARLDIDAVIDRLDFTALVRERVDLDAIVREVDIDAVAGRLDIDAVIARIDLVGLAQEVMDALDLPAIIRGSTASVASESVQDVRLQSIAADEAVSRVVDRLLLRRRHRPAGPNGVEHPLAESVSATETVPVQREVPERSPQP